MDAMERSIVSEGRNPRGGAAEKARRAGRVELREHLLDARARTLRLLASYERALGPALPVAQRAELNPPLWELGHIGWFADWWIARNPERAKGCGAAPDAQRTPARQAVRAVDADALYNSSTVPHGQRWSLPLPDLATTVADLHAGLHDTLQHLERAAETDDGLYFFRLALFHEDMHGEAWVHMAQTLGIDSGEAPPPLNASPHGTLYVETGSHALGWPGPGFAFDNERGSHTLQVPAFEIDAAPVTWARYLPAVQAGAVPMPRYVRREGAAWRQQVSGRWQALNADEPVCHVSALEARAWCRWAQRRLPTEAEWERAAQHEAFDWGRVWEWTASPFAPLPGFEPHPYRDYSQPWFDGRPVLKGASWATVARLGHPRFRNFYPAERNDVLAGFRSVALQAPTASG